LYTKSSVFKTKTNWAYVKIGSMKWPLSQRAEHCPASPIRKLVPLADKAKAAGVKIYHLNIGQPDINSPTSYLAGLKSFPEKIVAYENSLGNPQLRQRLAEYYQKLGLKLKADNILVTAGASEAIIFSLMATADPGDNCLVIEPFYANYLGFSQMAGIKLKPITSRVETGFHLPPARTIEKAIDKKTKAIIVCNPNNPTGTVYRPEELNLIMSLAKKHNLFIIADETYREFVYAKTKHRSCLKLGQQPKNVILVDSFSKRYSLCGARLGCLASFNQKVIAAVTKFCQARLAVSTVSQYAASKLLKGSQSFIKPKIREYQLRRDLVIEALEKMKGVTVRKPEGAFYAMVKLPVRDSEAFCRWLLTKFRYKKATVMLAPGSGFYLSKNLGRDEVRLAYVINRQELKQAMIILDQALKEYQKK
jgi:aspartate aminotransferase